MAALCRQLRDELSLAVLTNDIYTTEDADFLRRHAVLPDGRIAAVQTGGCPHTAIRDDITANLDAIDDLIAGNEGLDLILVESGGDNLTATFSSGLVDVQIFVVDVAGGDKVPRKGGPGVTYSDLLVINKTDLAPLVGADLDVMRRDAARVRNDRPVRVDLADRRSDGSAGARLGARAAPRAGVEAWRTMISDVLIVARPDRVPSIECSGGVAARRTDADTVHLVSAAATPLGGDTIRVRVVVEAGARLLVRSAAATMAMPGTATMESRASWELEVAGLLDLDPQPTIVAGQARHVTTTRLSLSGDGRARLRERVQIGRSHEREGFWSGSMHADVDGSPLLRHRVELGTGSVDRRRTRHAIGLCQRIALPRNGIRRHRHATGTCGRRLPGDLAGREALAALPGRSARCRAANSPLSRSPSPRPRCPRVARSWFARRPAAR